MHPTEQLGPTWDCSSWDQRTIGIVAAGTSLESRLGLSCPGSDAAGRPLIWDNMESWDQ